MLSHPRTPENKARQSRLKSPKRKVEGSHSRLELFTKLIGDRIEKIFPRSYMSIEDTCAQLLEEGPERVLPVFRYETGPIEIELNDCNGEAEVPGSEDEGIFTEKCTVSYAEPSGIEDDEGIQSDPEAFLGELSIVVRLECENPKTGLQIHRLKDMVVCGFGPTKWVLTAFYEDEKVFETRGVSNTPKEGEVILGNFEFSFFC